ncbi:hypothetical protein AK830_g10110 [Neonectria ditissima]|uniref:Uncharacterized protein n=1 Tax=Neonectria ditissima TaxID=78410 RepID=A0A0N8H5K7_9HYPO|nr:hypothetical protein AK830_g10110 [Neonectria ditissima]
MDPFWNIPPELRLNILLHLGSPRNIKPLSLASPAMCKQSQVSGLHINRAFVASHLPGELLHDALAIIQFPRQDATGSSETDLAVHHIKRWAAHRLPNPFVDGLATAPQPRFNWDWAILYRYKKETMDLLMLETLRCVHAYICSLYGAMFARCADAWLPSYYTNLDFPDNVFFDPLHPQPITISLRWEEILKNQPT